MAYEDCQGHRPVLGGYDPIPAALERLGRVLCEVNISASSELDLRGGIFDMRLGLTLIVFQGNASGDEASEDQ